MRWNTFEKFLVYGAVIVNISLWFLIPRFWPDALKVEGAQSYVLNMLIWIVLANFQILIIVYWGLNRKKREERFWDVLEKLEANLSTIRKHYNEIRAQQNDRNCLFGECIEEFVIKLRETVITAAVKSQLEINQNHFDTTRILLNCMGGRKSDIFRAVHFLKDNIYMFNTPHAKTFFIKLHEKLIAKKIIEVQRIIVFDDPEDLNSPQSKKLIQFHRNTDCYSCKLIRREDYAGYLNDCGLERTTQDFGIYGNRYIYFAKESHSNKIVGLFSQDNYIINNHIKCFDEIWKHTNGNEYLHDDISNDGILITKLFEQ